MNFQDVFAIILKTNAKQGEGVTKHWGRKTEREGWKKKERVNFALASVTRSFFLCPGLDSNQHTSRRCHLKTVRLPISPPGHSEKSSGCKYRGNYRTGQRKFNCFHKTKTYRNPSRKHHDHSLLPGKCASSHLTTISLSASFLSYFAPTFVAHEYQYFFR